MKLALIGFGQAGGKIADQFVKYDTENQLGIVEEIVAVNSARADLQGLESIPEDRRILIGSDEVKGHGVGADNQKGQRIAESDLDEMMNKVNDVPVHKVDAFLVVAGLGGGTGSGGAPVLARELRRRYTEPVYGLGLLPAENEGGIYSMNAGRSLKTFVDQVDSLLLFDNDEWRESGESVSEGYDMINEEIIKRFSILFAAGVADNSSQVAESVVDASEIINTLECGGIASIGYASEEVEISSGLLDRFRSDDNGGLDTTGSEDTNRITSLGRQAVLGRLTLSCDVGTAKKALVIVSGPPEKLNRKGIEKARQWVEEETGTMEVRGGDYPVDDERVSVCVLLSGVTDSQRVKKMQEIGIEAKHNIEELSEQSPEELADLVKDDDDELDSLF